jgi:hypothetical protein
MFGKLLLWVLFMGLANQGIAAVIMPFCKHEPTQHHAMMSDEDHAAHAQGQAQEDWNCDDCASCHTCAAPAIPAVASLSLPSVKPPLAVAEPAHFSLFVPEQPQPPPLSIWFKPFRCPVAPGVRL